MKAKDLLLGLNFIDDTLLIEAEEPGFVRRNTHPWRRWGAMAACFAIIAAAVLAVNFPGRLFQNSSPGNASGSALGESSSQASGDSAAISLDMADITVNDAAPAQDHLRKYYAPEYRQLTWSAEDIAAYYGKELSPSYLPAGLTPSVLNGSATVFQSPDGTIVRDTVFLQFYHGYYPDGSPKFTDNVFAIKGFSVSVSKLGSPNDCCVYVLPEDRAKPSDIAGTPVTISYRSMSYGPYDAQTHAPTGYYDLYVSQFTLDGLQYEIVSDQLPMEEIVKITASVITNKSDFTLKNS